MEFQVVKFNEKEKKGKKKTEKIFRIVNI